MAPFGVGIIGCGMIAEFHAKAIADVRRMKLVGACSRNTESAKKFAETYGVRAFSSYEDMLADESVNAVSICTPSGAHMEPAISAARAGKHVIVEKPLEIDLKRCDRMIAECEKQGVALATIFPSRFNQSAQLLKSAVESEKFGRLTVGDAYVKWHRSQEYYDSGQWRGTWDLDGGGALMNQAIHSVDLLIWLMGPVRQVTANTATLAHDRIEVEDIATAIIQFESGALGVIEATTAAYPGWLRRIEIHGTHGSARLEGDQIQQWEFAKMTARDKKLVAQFADGAGNGGASDPKSISYAGHTAQFKDFVDAIKKGRAPSIDGHQGRLSVELIRAIYKSARSQKPVSLPLKSDRLPAL